MGKIEQYRSFPDVLKQVVEIYNNNESKNIEMRYRKL